MTTDPQLKQSYPRLINATRRWRQFSKKWHHCYLLLLAMFSVAWRTSAMAIPVLENTRINGGLHPMDVLLLMDEIKLLWAPPLVAAALYALSFFIQPLNTAKAIAISALCSSAILALILLSALIVISGWMR